jgi:hypothetical protein
MVQLDMGLDMSQIVKSSCNVIHNLNGKGVQWTGKKHEDVASIWDQV